MDLKEIPGTNGRYYASTDGRIWSTKLNKYLKLRPMTSGYLRVNIGPKAPAYVHRLIALTYLGEPTKRTVNHKDGNKQNNNVSNLEYATHSEQNYHAYKTGLAKTKLKFDIEEIKDLQSKGLNFKEIGAYLGCSPRTVSSYLCKKKTNRKKPNTTIADRIKRSRVQGGRPFNVYKDDEFIGRYETPSLCAESLKISAHTIRSHLQGRRKQFNGYIAKWT